MRRREFLRAFVSTVAVCPIAARAQQQERMRRICILMTLAVDDPEGKARIKAFEQALQQHGWIDGQNILIETFWTGGNPDHIRKSVEEIVKLPPDVVMATGTSTVAPLIQASRNIPIVFARVVDPVAAGFVEDLARPGGNATGFTQFEYSLSGKWLELLKEIAPGVRRAAIIRDPTVGSGAAQLAAIQTVASSMQMELNAIGLRDPSEIERAIAALARRGDAGMIVTVAPRAILHRSLIINLAAKHRLPTVFPARFYVTDGGLISYGPNSIEPYRRAASYVDRILRGAKPADLPVQAPTKYELLINLKTARNLSIVVPPSVLARADEVIE